MQDLLSQTTGRKHIDVAVISKPYRNHVDGFWVKDRIGKAALWTIEEQAFQRNNRSPGDRISHNGCERREGLILVVKRRSQLFYQEEMNLVLIRIHHRDFFCDCLTK